MAVLQALGIDSTIFFQFIIATLSFFALESLVYKPYADALAQRINRTTGGEEEAHHLIKDSADLRARYEQRARELNSQTKTIFDSYREETQKQYDAILAKARSESQQLMDATRAKVAQQINQASLHLQEEIPQLAQAMSSRLLSKKA